MLARNQPHLSESGMMKADRLTLLGSVALAALPAVTAALAGEEVSERSARDWLQHLRPLPREIHLSAKVTLKLGQIAVAGDTNASKLIVLDAHDFAKPPVAEVPLPQRVPFGFHGNWVAD